jgi:preprotein translocase subunit SecD
MKKNLKNKTIGIVAVLLVCIYGIIGRPSGFSGAALLDAIGQRIHLGLDLRGGVHLILQVVVSEAVSADPAGPEGSEPELYPGVQARSDQATPGDSD